MATKLRDPKDTGKVLGGIAVATLARWRWSGRGPRFIKIGGRVMYDEADLDAFIEQRRRRSTSEKNDYPNE